MAPEEPPMLSPNRYFVLDSHKFALGHFLVNTFIIAWFLLLAN